MQKNTVVLQELRFRIVCDLLLKRVLERLGFQHIAVLFVHLDESLGVLERFVHKIAKN